MNRLTRARALVVATFLSAALFQGYALFTQRDPPVDAVYTPHPYFLMTFFVMQVGLQFYWIVQLFRRNVRELGPTLLSEEDDGFGVVDNTNIETDRNTGEPTQMAYVPLYALGNLFLGAYTSHRFGL
jgi:hypothetical protein